MKRVFIIHGWDGSPENHWFPWLKKELKKIGFKVIVPAMPHSSEPKIELWVSHLNKIVGKVNEETYFVGHSIGCQAIMRYLETVDDNSKVGGIVFVAGFFNLPFLKTRMEKIIAKPWLETTINTNKIKKQTKQIVAIFSDNDAHVSLDEAPLFERKLGAKVIVEKNKGHFTLEQGIDTLPSALNSIKKMIL